jgi:hypothetical protein
MDAALTQINCTVARFFADRKQFSVSDGASDFVQVIWINSTGWRSSILIRATSRASFGFDVATARLRRGTSMRNRRAYR